MNLAVESIVDGVLRASLGLSLAAMAIGVLSRVLKLRSPRLEQWAWGIVLFHGVIVTPLVLSIPVPWPASAAATTPNIRTVQYEPVVATIESSSDVAIPDVPASPPLDFVGTGQAINAKSLANLRESQPADSAVVLSWRHIAFLVWVSGIVLLAGVGGLRYAAFARRIDQSGEIPEEWLDEWRHVCSQMAVVKNVPLVVTDLMGPALVRMPSGYRLVVPRVQWAQLSSVQRRAILRHEAAHLQRGDVWTALIARTVGMIHWFNPFAWWAVQRFEAQAELACDRIAAGDEPTIFAEALFKLGAARSSRISGAIAVKSGSLSDRVKQLLSDAPGSPRWKRIALIAIAVGALLPTAIRVQGVTYAEPKREPVAVDESSPGEWGNQPEFSPEGKAIAVPLNNVVALFDVNTGERVDRDEETSSVEVDADGGGSIVGIVQDSKGNPIANAVLKNAGMSSREVRETTADTEGRFSLANLYRGPRGPEIIVYAPGFISRRLKVVPGPADNPAEIAITMEPGHHIKGRVTDEGGQSLEGVGVSFADGNHPFSIGNRRVTDKEGRFEFDSLSADCPFSFFKAGYSQIENRQLPLDTDDVVAVKMIPSGIILGRVIDRTTGNPIPSFNVRIYYSPTRMPDDPKAALLADWVRPGQSFQSDEGQFQLGDLVAGMPLQLSIDVEGYETAVNERVVAKRSDEVGEGDEVRFELDLIDPATLRKYSGRLVDANGKPVVGAQLRLIVARDRPKLDRTRFPFNWKMIESGQIAEQAKVLRFLRGETDEEGRFEFPPVPRMAEIELAWWGENILAGRSDHLETHDEESTIEIKQDADAKDAREKEKEKAFFDSSNSTPKTPDAEAQVSKEFEIPIDVSGKALDGESQPISAAKIYLTSPRNRGKPLAVTETDKDGLYQFEAVPLPIKRADTNSGQDTGSFEVIGEADGYGFAWRPLKRVYPDVENAVEPNWDTNSVRDLPTRYGLKDKIELDLTFLKASKLSGRIVNDLGEPIGGTAIAIRHCDTEWDREDLNRFGSQYELESINWPELVPPRIKTRRTDADGHFEFDGLPANCRFWIEVRPPGYTPRNIHAVTHDRADVDEAGNRVYSGNFEVDFVRPHKVNIRVVYGDSGEPAPKVGIGGNVSEAGFWETTDENGMVEVPLPDGRYKLSLLPRYGTNYLRTEFELAVSADSVKDIVEIKLRPAAVVDITVLDFETKKPLAGVDVWFADEGSTPQRLNRRVHGYRSWEVETRISHYERPRSDKDGKMRVLFEPGTHQIGVGLNARPSWYVPVEGDGLLIDCKAGETVTAEFHLKNVKKAR